VARRPLEREQICLDGGRRTTQLMRDSLGGSRTRDHMWITQNAIDAFGALLGPVSLGVLLVTLLVSRFSSRARAAQITAGVSPFWVLLPPSLAVIAALLAGDRPGTVPWGVPAPGLALLVVQCALSGWIIYRHRRWLWVALPIALVMLVWSAITGLMLSLSNI